MPNPENPQYSYSKIRDPQLRSFLEGFEEYYHPELRKTIYGTDAISIAYGYLEKTQPDLQVKATQNYLKQLYMGITQLQLINLELDSHGKARYSFQPDGLRAYLAYIFGVRQELGDRVRSIYLPRTPLQAGFFTTLFLIGHHPLARQFHEPIYWEVKHNKRTKQNQPAL